MTKIELAKIVTDTPLGSKITIKKKSLFMSKYGNSKRFIPRTVNYSSYDAILRGISDDGEFLLTEIDGRDSSEYFSKIQSIKTI